MKVASDELQDHLQAHSLERRWEKQAQARAESDLGDGTPEALAFRVVELLRERGSGLPGNRQTLTFKLGDSVNALWKEDRRWWAATITRDNGDGTYAIAWAAPYANWPGEPRQQASEVTLLRGAETRE